MDISIVFPVLNEAHKIASDLESAVSFLTESHLNGEMIIVDDGSTDKTAEAAQGASIPRDVRRQVIRLENNKGKGFAVRTGVLASSGEVVLVVDSGTCVPYNDALPYIERIRSAELDIALASRRLKDTVILTISNDLPFAQERFCGAEGIDNVVTLSQLRNRTFGRKYGIEIVDGPMAGLLGRAIVVLDSRDTVIHTELVPEITQEPDYEAAVEAVKS